MYSVVQIKGQVNNVIEPTTLKYKVPRAKGTFSFCPREPFYCDDDLYILINLFILMIHLKRYKGGFSQFKDIYWWASYVSGKLRTQNLFHFEFICTESGFFSHQCQ